MTRLDRYELGPVVGEGGMGVVHRAHDPILGREVAIKLLRGVVGPEELLRFAREAEALAALRHPNVVQLHGSGSWQGRPYIVMEWVPGLSLRELLRRRGKLEPLEACALLGPVAGALAVAHAHGIVHRDVKPENLLLGGDGRALLTDFGIARNLSESERERLTRTGEGVGTPGYISPEQLLGGRGGPASDVFALAVVLHELVCGVHPFPGESALERMHATLERRAGPLPGGGRRLQGLLARCLDKDPGRRPSAGELARGLREATEGRRTSPALLVAGSVLAAGAAAAAVLLAAGGGPGAPVHAGAEPAPGHVSSEAAGASSRLKVLASGAFQWSLPDGQGVDVVRVPGQDGRAEVFLARHELSWEAYLRFLRVTGSEGRRTGDRARAPGRTAATLSWLEALEYCAWAGGRLPTLDEWQRATRLQGSGFQDLAGGVREWVQDRLRDHPSLAATPEQTRLEPVSRQEPIRDTERLLCGGSRTPSLEEVGSCPQDRWLADSGVRLALDPEEARPARPVGPISAPLTWTVEGITFEPVGEETVAKVVMFPDVLRSYEQLDQVAIGRLGPVRIEKLDLRFRGGGAEVFDEAPVDWFALRATTRTWLPAGRWRLVVAAADDGVRVWRDGRLTIDVWQHGVFPSELVPRERMVDTFELTRSAEVGLRVEHVELWGEARLNVLLELEQEGR